MGLKVWLPLNEDLRNQGASGATITNNGATINTSGKIGSCYAFSGSNQYLYSSYNFYNTQYSVTAWIYTTSSSATQTIVCDRTSVGYGFSIFLIGGKLRIDPGGNNIQWTTNYTYPINTWFHLGITYNGTKVAYYINGEFKQDYTCTLASNYWGTTTSVGASQANGSGYGNYLNGRLNDVRIYDHCLSAAEVREISQGLVLHYKLNDPIGFTDIILNRDTYVVYNNYSGSGTTGTLTNLNEYYNGTVIRREVMTPNDTSVANFRNSLGSHGVYGHRQTFLANTKYVFWIYYRPVSHMDIRVGGTASNIGGWTEIPPVAVGGGWYKVGQYRNGTVTTDKTDSIFTSFYTPTAASGVPITIDWASPHLLEGTTEIPPYDYPSTIIQDSSGYNHNGIIRNTVLISSDTPRYSSSVSLPNTNSMINCGRGGMVTDSITINFWCKYTTYTTAIVSAFESYGVGFNEHNSSVSFTPYITGIGWCRSHEGTNAEQITAASLAGVWHMWTGVYDRINKKVKLYIDGELKQEKDISTAAEIRYNTSNVLWIGGEATSSSTTGSNATAGLFSDFRIYCTPIDTDAIHQLYEVGAKVDNKNQLHAFEFIEPNQQEITKYGQVKAQNILETYLPLYDKTIYEEPDGSQWIHIFHHNNPTNSKFNEPTLDWTTGKYLDADRWYDVDQAVYHTLGPYEFLYKQKTTSSATETKYRWIQIANPLTAAWADVKPGTITANTSSGYSACQGGLYPMKNSSLHMCIANGTNGNWYGGIGAAAAYQGGIPGYPNTVVTSGCIDLYLRVYSKTKFIKNIGVSSAEFIEL